MIATYPAGSDSQAALAAAACAVASHAAAEVLLGCVGTCFGGAESLVDVIGIVR